MNPYTRRAFSLFYCHYQRQPENNIRLGASYFLKCNKQPHYESFHNTSINQRNASFHTSAPRLKLSQNHPEQNQSEQTTTTQIPSLSSVLRRLRNIDTAALCDADKSIRQDIQTSNFSDYEGLSLMNPSIKSMTLPSSFSLPPTPPSFIPHTHDTKDYNTQHSTIDPTPTSFSPPTIKLVGVARTVQCTQPNDFLAVLEGLYEAQPGEVLIVNTLKSTRAIAGGLFVTEAHRRNLAGMVIDGPVRDIIDMQLATSTFSNTGKNKMASSTMTTTPTATFSSSSPIFPCYATSITPYSGTVNSLGKLQIPIECGGILVRPGDIVVGDNDGIVVGSLSTFATLMELVVKIQYVENKVMEEMKSGEGGRTLFDMINFKEHLEKRRDGKESVLEFKSLK